MKKSAYQQMGDEVKILINEAKVRNNLNDEGLAKKIGMPLPTLRNRKCNPGRFRMDDIWLIEQLVEYELRTAVHAEYVGGPSALCLDHALQRRHQVDEHVTEKHRGRDEQQRRPSGCGRVVEFTLDSFCHIFLC